MRQHKWFVVVPFPLPSNMQSLLASMPGWGRSLTFGGHELLLVFRPDLRDALVAAGAMNLPHSARSASAIPSNVVSAAAFTATPGASVADFLAHLYGDDSWAD